MVNKTNALNKIEQIKNYLKNVQASAYRGDMDSLTEKFETLDELLEDLESTISSENEEYLNRPYGTL
jgi:CRISPR/Cas system-associated endoribonuclease Cas2